MYLCIYLFTYMLYHVFLIDIGDMLDRICSFISVI